MSRSERRYADHFSSGLFTMAFDALPSNGVGKIVRRESRLFSRSHSSRVHHNLVAQV